MCSDNWNNEQLASIEKDKDTIIVTYYYTQHTFLHTVALIDGGLIRKAMF